MITNLANILPINVVGVISGTLASGTPTSVFSRASVQNVVIINQDPINVNLVSGTGGGGVTDHGNLTGLGDDDHPQYGLVASNETISGVWDFTNSLTVSGIPVNVSSLNNIVEDTTPQLGGTLDAQNNDISGINELTAVTGTFTTGLTIGTSTITITDDSIDVSGNRVSTEKDLTTVSGHLVETFSGEFDAEAIAIVSTGTGVQNIKLAPEGIGVGLDPSSLDLFTRIASSGIGRNTIRIIGNEPGFQIQNTSILTGANLWGITELPLDGSLVVREENPPGIPVSNHISVEKGTGNTIFSGNIEANSATFSQPLNIGDGQGVNQNIVFFASATEGGITNQNHSITISGGIIIDWEVTDEA